MAAKRDGKIPGPSAKYAIVHCTIIVYCIVYNHFKLEMDLSTLLKLLKPYNGGRETINIFLLTLITPRS